MNKAIKTSLLLGVAASGMTVAVPALAQDTRANVEDDAIIVTARRVEENLQDVPISITVYNQKEINKRNIVVAADLATYTPSLSVSQQYGPEKSSFALRGFNQDQNTAPTVGVYFADVVGVRAQGGTTSGNTVGAGAFTDLQNVQVLKGPQGTLFGRNTTGGAILLVPTRPTDRLEGYVEGSIGNYNMRRVQAALNVPLADTFRVRLSVDRNKRDGFMKNHVEGSPSNYNDVDYVYGRLGIVADLTPELENYTIFHYSRSETNSYAFRLIACDRNPVDFTDPTGVKNPASPAFNFLRVVYAEAGCDQIDRQAARGDGKLDVDVRLPGQFLNLEQWQFINTTTWHASDTLTVKNIVSYGELRERTKFNLASSNYSVPALPFPLTDVTAGAVGLPLDTINLDLHPGEYNSAGSTLTEELQLQGETTDGRFNFVVGGYLEFSRPIGWNSGRTGVYGDCDAATLDCNTPLGFAIISQSRVKVNFDNHGVFAQGTYRLTDQLSLTGGFRYTFDKIAGQSISTRYTIAPIPGLGNVIAAQNCNDGLRHKNPDGSAIDISDPIVFPGVGQIAGGDGSHDEYKCLTRLVNKSNKPTWLIDLDYKVTPDVLLYAKWARGYRQGGMTFTNPGLETWGPESLDSYEAGVKATFRGAVSGFFNVAAYYNDFTDQQVITNSIPKPGSGLSGGNVVANAGKSEIYGVEVDAGATFFDSLRFTLGYSYLRTKVKDFVAPTLPADSPFASLEKTTDVGLPLTLSPKHRLTATATYTLPLDESIGDVSIGATYTYTARQNANFASPYGEISPTNLLNLNFEWDRVAGSDFDLAVFATNITNEIYPVAVASFYGTYGFEGRQYGRPRMYGVRVRYNFGQ